MTNYQEIQQQQQNEFNALPVKFAFNNGQLEKGLKELNATQSEVVSIGAGGFMRKDQSHLYVEHIKKWAAEDKKNMENPEYVYQMFRYELGNHEYSYTGDLTDTLAACGLSYEKVLNNPMLLEQLRRAGGHI